MKSFAISLYHVSGKAYRLVSKFFHLPPKSSLLRWVSGLPLSPGISQPALDAIESKVKRISDAAKSAQLQWMKYLLKRHFNMTPQEIRWSALRILEMATELITWQHLLSYSWPVVLHPTGNSPSGTI